MEDYRFLRVARVIFKILAWLVVGFSLIVIVVLITQGGNIPTMTAQGVVNTPVPKTPMIISLVLQAGIAFLVFYSLSEIIGLLLEVKDSTDKGAV